jgi:hypothetical protein
MTLGLIPHHLKGKSGFMDCKGASVYHEPRGFIYDNKIRVLVEDLKGAGGAGLCFKVQNKRLVSRRLFWITVPG